MLDWLFGLPFPRARSHTSRQRPTLDSSSFSRPHFFHHSIGFICFHRPFHHPFIHPSTTNHPRIITPIHPRIRICQLFALVQYSLLFSFSLHFNTFHNPNLLFQLHKNYTLLGTFLSLFPPHRIPVHVPHPTRPLPACLFLVT